MRHQHKNGLSQNKWDKISSNLAAFFALCVALFPMNVYPSHYYCNILYRSISSWRNYVHYGSAGAFFLTLAAMSYFLFTKTKDDDKANMTPQKIKRNKLYRICAVIMCVAIVLIGSLNIKVIGNALEPYKPIFVLETIALWAFGLSWLTKGEFLLKDR